MLNQYGVLGPYWVRVRIDGITGDVVGYIIPRDTSITGPTVPLITEAQARQIAVPYARYDLSQVPFTEAVVDLSEDVLGVQWLTWTVRQYPTPQDPTDHFGVYVDAISGEVTGVEAPLGSRADREVRPVPPLPHHVRLLKETASGEEVRSAAFPAIEKGSTWVRVELLRGLGARVKTDRKGAQVRAGDKTLTAAQVGAKWRDYGWWVPLRPAAEALGWQVAWQAATKDVVVTTRPAKP